MDWSTLNTEFVEIIQTRLRDAGLYEGKIDGKAGRLTRGAWQLFAASTAHTGPVTGDVAPADSSLIPFLLPAAGGWSYRPRDAWEADAAYSRLGYPVDREKRTEVFVHHTVTVDTDATQSVWETWDEIAAHMRRLQTIRPDLRPNDQVGPDVPYTAVCFVTPVGGLIICEGRGLERTGAHTHGHNTAALGFSWAGDFETHPPDPRLLDRALEAFGAFLRDLRSENGFSQLGTSRPSAGRALWGHRDIKGTLCPGQALYERLERVRL